MATGPLSPKTGGHYASGGEETQAAVSGEKEPWEKRSRRYSGETKVGQDVGSLTPKREEVDGEGGRGGESGTGEE